MLVVVRYHEIALKGRNRPFFVDRLARNVRRALSDLGGVRVHVLRGRLILEIRDEAAQDVVAQRLQCLFGIANYARAYAVGTDVEELKAEATQALASRRFASFRVSAKRANKAFPKTSGDLERELGAAIQKATGAAVDLENPALTVFVEVLKDRILFSFEKIRGLGGFPVGTSGRVLALLSGGIDSPVAAVRMMQRGCSVVLTHFHSFPLLDRTTIDKARELARILTRYQFRTRLLLVPFAAAQQAIVASCPAPLRVVLYRRFMVRIAEALAASHHAKALVTGESLGQVASQTLANLSVIDAAARGMVLRPLVGMDKEEITVEARRLGTFETSTLPDQDCCQLYVPKSPATAATYREVAAAESALDISALVEGAVSATETERFVFPPGAN